MPILLRPLLYLRQPSRAKSLPSDPDQLLNPASKIGSDFVGPGKAAAMVSIVATAYFLTAAVVAHAVMIQYNFFSDYISDYAVGPWGWIYGSAFVASAIGCLALAVSLSLLLPSHALSRIGVVLLVLVGVTYIIDFAYPTDILPPGAPPTTTVGMVHLLDALLGWVLFTVGSIVISSPLKYNAYWKVWRPLLTTLAWLSVLLLVVLVGVVISKAAFGGLAEKLFILDRNVWALALGILAFNAPNCVPPHGGQQCLIGEVTAFENRVVGDGGPCSQLGEIFDHQPKRSLSQCHVSSGRHRMAPCLLDQMPICDEHCSALVN
jgi:hypothetical protein